MTRSRAERSWLQPPVEKPAKRVPPPAPGPADKFNAWPPPAMRGQHPPRPIPEGRDVAPERARGKATTPPVRVCGDAWRLL